MRALSIKQPWAWLIVNDYKNIENRSWPTKYRGVFLVHASLKFDAEAFRFIRDTIPAVFRRMPREYDDYQRGGIVGTVNLVDCVTEHKSKWFAGENYGFVLKDGQPLPFLALKGKLGFFETGIEQER